MDFLKKLLKLLPLKRNNIRNRIRKDIRNFRVNEDIRLCVYWKVLKIGRGPAVTVNVKGKEIAKYDCFGKEKGHYHLAPDYGRRIYFKEQTAAEQIERTYLEITNNFMKIIDNQDCSTVKKVGVEQPDLETATAGAKKRMLYLLETVPEIRGI